MTGRPRVISGTWMDFHHPNVHDGDYWNEATARFTPADWEAKVAEMVEAGMFRLVVMSVALRGQSFYPSRLISERWPLVTEDPIAAVLAAAERYQAEVYLGVGFFGHDTGAARAESPEEERLRREIPKELADRYGHFRSFAGWYLPVEAGVQGHFPPEYLPYANQLGEWCRKAASKPVFIAPYGTRTIRPDERFVQQLKGLEVDWLAWQDEVGVRKTRVEELPEIYQRLVKVHQEAGKRLWMDVEVFEFEGPVYDSALIPAPWERLEKQLTVIPPEVEEVLCYQYLGLMNRPGSRAFAGHPDSVRLYEEYQSWRRRATAGNP